MGQSGSDLSGCGHPFPILNFMMEFNRLGDIIEYQDGAGAAAVFAQQRHNIPAQMG